jgi:hypothetical protein
MSHTVTVTDNGFIRAAVSVQVFPKDPQFAWEFQSGGLIIQNDGLRTIEYSFNGKDVAGDVTPQDKWVALDVVRQTRIFIRIKPTVPGTPSCSYRVRVWRGEG